MTIETFCATPKTMSQIQAEGYTPDMVYNRVKKGVLVNINRQDEWGRTKRGKGLFQISDECRRKPRIDRTKSRSEINFDARDLLSAWRKS